MMPPLDSRAQQPERARRIGVLLGLDENDSDAQLRLVAFKEGLAGLGWAERRNLTFDVRWSALDPYAGNAPPDPTPLQLRATAD